MRTRYLAIAAAALRFPALADETPEATSSACAFAFDPAGAPVALKTASDIASLRPATYQPVDTVTLVAPDGTETTVVSGAPSAGTAALPITAVGGVWTAHSSRSGTATFTVRRSLDSTLGAGTAASPARLVDGDELVDYNAGDGYVFTLDAWDGLLDSLTIPSGVRLEELDGGAWSLVSSSDGCEYAWAGAASFPVDSRRLGPDRTTKKADALPISFSGDHWVGDPSKAATLTIVPPGGETSTFALAGTGAQPFTFGKPGDWSLTLAMADGTTRQAVVTILGEAFVLVVQ